MAVSAVECLSAMAINGEESSLLEYTTRWTALVNRGLFEINDATYVLFRDIEMKVRTHLQGRSLVVSSLPGNPSPPPRQSDSVLS